MWGTFIIDGLEGELNICYKQRRIEKVPHISNYLNWKPEFLKPFSKGDQFSLFVGEGTTYVHICTGL